jgi:hypothetical protein
MTRVLLFNEGVVDKFKQLKILVSIKILHQLKKLIIWGVLELHNISHLFNDGIVVMLFILISFEILEGFPDIFNEFKDGFKIVVINAVFDLVITFKSVIMPQE